MTSPPPTPAPRPQIHPSPVLLAGGAVIAQVFYPLVFGTARDRLAVVAVLLFCAASLTHAALTRGPRCAVGLLVVFGGGGLLVEIVGLATGFPFGRYQYGDGLGPALAGTPLVIGLAWTMMAWPCWLAAGRLTRHRGRRIVAAAWALAAWDLFLDPQMVGEGYWRWTDPRPGLPGVYGVPLTNYLGWLLVALVLMSVFSRLADAHREVPDPLDAVPIALLGWVYVSSILAHTLFFGLPYAALWGAAAMGLVVLPVLARGNSGLR